MIRIHFLPQLPEAKGKWFSRAPAGREEWLPAPGCRRARGREWGVPVPTTGQHRRHAGVRARGRLVFVGSILEKGTCVQCSGRRCGFPEASPANGSQARPCGFRLTHSLPELWSAFSTTTHWVRVGAPLPSWAGPLCQVLGAARAGEACVPCRAGGKDSVGGLAKAERGTAGEATTSA